jgi:hypothetical protein
MALDINQIASLPDFATLYNWRLEFSSTPTAVTSFPTNDALNLRCTSATIPKLTGEDIQVDIKQFRAVQPGIYRPEGPITLIFVETANNEISKFLRDWRNACYDKETGGQESNADVYANVLLYRQDRNNNDIWEYHLKYCFLSNYEPGGELGGDSDVLRPSVDLTYITFDERSI